MGETAGWIAIGVSVDKVFPDEYVGGVKKSASLSSDGNLCINGTFTELGDAWETGDCICVLIDPIEKTLRFIHNDNDLGVACDYEFLGDSVYFVVSTSHHGDKIEF